MSGADWIGFVECWRVPARASCTIEGFYQYSTNQPIRLNTSRPTDRSRQSERIRERLWIFDTFADGDSRDSSGGRGPVWRHGSKPTSGDRRMARPASCRMKRRIHTARRRRFYCRTTTADGRNPKLVTLVLHEFRTDLTGSKFAAVLQDTAHLMRYTPPLRGARKSAQKQSVDCIMDCLFF